MMPETRLMHGFRLAGRIALVALVLAGVGWMIANRGHLDSQSLASAIGYVPGGPLVIPLFFLLVHIVASLIFFPRTVLAVAAGALFGVWWGTFWAALGSVIGAVAGFLLARYVNDGIVDLENMRRFGPLLLRAERGGWRAVAVLRLVPVLPHTLTNYALGLTRLDLGGYALGSLLGQLPMTIACADLGAAGQSFATGKAGWVGPTLIGLAVLVLSLVVPRMARPRMAVPPTLPSPSRGEGDLS